MSSSIVISIEDQSLYWRGENDQQKAYQIASAKNGVGQQFGSECTPLGVHVIRAKIGANQPENTVFVGRRPTGETYTEELAEDYPNRDWILTRILWLSGCEPGFNRLGSVDTMRRFIYIHGAPDSHPMQTLSSHGCIKMRNVDVIDLFDRVAVGDKVSIVLEKQR